MKKSCIRLLTFLLLMPSPVLAWDGSARGKVAEIKITDATNYGFRVYLEGWPTLCGNALSWAYVDKADESYDSYVATILTAKHTGTEVHLFSDQAGTDNLCRIGFLISY